jgi:MYXO-CTERM domain-containing protein
MTDETGGPTMRKVKALLAAAAIATLIPGAAAAQGAGTGGGGAGAAAGTTGGAGGAAGAAAGTAGGTAGSGLGNDQAIDLSLANTEQRQRDRGFPWGLLGLLGLAGLLARRRRDGGR